MGVRGKPAGERVTEVTVKFLPCGDSALVVEFGDRIDRKVSEAVLRLAARLRHAALEGVLEAVPTFRSLLVHYDPLRASAASLETAIAALLGAGAAHERPKRLWRVPVCYESALAPDLGSVAERTGLSPEAVVDLHSGTRYYIYMLGFMPGFPYMGDLPEPLVLPRRVDPRVRVPAGSVAIATALTAIYPLESPGGWHLIGSTPIRMFDPAAASPALFAPGDEVQFEPIGQGAYAELQGAVARGDYRVPHERAVA